MARKQLLRPDLDHLIRASGPEDAAGLAVGEAGGADEHRARRAFVGKSGVVFNAYLNAAGIARPDLRVTNIYPFWPGPGNPDPPEDWIREYEHLLLDEIERLRPKVILAVGRIAAQWFAEDDDLTMETVHGVPMMSRRAPDSIVIPAYHPAAGFHNPELAAFCQDDILQFAYLLKNPVEPPPPPKIRIVLHDEADADAILNPYVDTEGLEDRPWGLSWFVGEQDSDGAYVGHVWLYAPGKRRPRFRGRVVFHNAPHDLKILRAMGYDTDEFDYGDTMVRAFNLRLEPQALKALGWRHLGLRMDSFDDVVRPHFDALANSFLADAAAHADVVTTTTKTLKNGKVRVSTTHTDTYSKPDAVVIDDYTKKKIRVYRPQGPGARLKSLTRTIADKPRTKIEKRWAKIGENEAEDLTERFQFEIERKVGRSFPDFSIFCVPLDLAVNYSGMDAVVTGLVDAPLTARIEAKGLEAVYEMDRRAIPFVDRCQQTGMRFEPKLLRALELDLEAVREDARDRVQRVAGNRWFNPGSADQVAKWLYDWKGLPIAMRTEGGRGSTNDAALKMLRGYHKEDEDVVEFITALDAYREADKCLGTFIEPIFAYAIRDRRGNWRIHPNLRITRVLSGRLSSHEPNVLAFPTRTELGHRIRDCFVAEDGFVLLSVDESQVELRVMADHCGDNRMIEAFEADEDLHCITTALIFKLPLEVVLAAKKGTDEAAKRINNKRYAAKQINFAVMYGISARALLDQLYKAEIFDFELEDCERFIREWFQIYGSVLRYLKKLWKHAAEVGYVTDMWGRICYVPNLRVMDDKIREAAQRLAGNAPIQGGANGLVKRAQTRLHDHVRAEGLERLVRPWLQIHDELLLEVREPIVESIADDVKGFMLADQNRLRVPLKTDAVWARSWGEL